MLPNIVSSNPFRITGGISGDVRGYREGIQGSMNPVQAAYYAGGQIYGIYSLLSVGVYYLNFAFWNEPTPVITRTIDLYINGIKYTLTKSTSTNWQVVVGSHIFADGVEYGIRAV